VKWTETVLVARRRSDGKFLQRRVDRDGDEYLDWHVSPHMADRRTYNYDVKVTDLVRTFKGKRDARA
jgi:hypothetical protein